MKMHILYEFDQEPSDGGELAEMFLNDFLEDVDGLDHVVESIENDMEGPSVSATIKTRARVTDEWFANADTAVVL